MRTFPVPEGPKRRIPFHGDKRPVKYLERKEKYYTKRRL